MPDAREHLAGVLRRLQQRGGHAGRQADDAAGRTGRCRSDTIAPAMPSAMGRLAAESAKAMLMRERGDDEGRVIDGDADDRRNQEDVRAN